MVISTHKSFTLHLFFSFTFCAKDIYQYFCIEGSIKLRDNNIAKKKKRKKPVALIVRVSRANNSLCRRGLSIWVSSMLFAKLPYINQTYIHYLT